MYHISHQGQQFGPYTVEQINEYLAQGAFDASSHVWDANVNGWVEIWQLPGVILPAVDGATLKPIAPGHSSTNAPSKDSLADIPKSLKAVIIIASILCFCVWAFITLMATLIVAKGASDLFYVAYGLFVLCFLGNLWGALRLSRVATSKKVTFDVRADGVTGAKVVMYMNIITGILIVYAGSLTEMRGPNLMGTFGIFSLISGVSLIFPIVKLGK